MQSMTTSSPDADSRRILSELSALRREILSLAGDPGTAASDRLAAAGDGIDAIHEEIRRQAEHRRVILDRDGAGSARRFLAGLPFAAVLTTASARIVETNDAACDLLGLPPQHLVGTPLLPFGEQEDRGVLRTALTRVLRGAGAVQVEARLVARTGTVVPVRVGLIGDMAGAGPASGVVRWVLVPTGAPAPAPAAAAPAAVPVPAGQLHALTELCGLGGSGRDLRSALGELVHLCRRGVDGVDDASLVVGSPGEPRVSVSTSARAQHLDGVQYVGRNGPSFAAFAEGAPVAAGAEPGPDAAGSTLAVPLAAAGAAVGVLTLYAGASGVLTTDAARRQALPFAAAAHGLVVNGEEFARLRLLHEQLTEALSSRAVIDQAKGMVMMTLQCDAESAFRHLVRLSNNQQVKVRDIALAMVADAGSGLLGAGGRRAGRPARGVARPGG